MKEDEGIDLVGDLSNENFRNEVKKLKPKLILCNNILMYLNKNTRKKLSNTLYEVLDKNDRHGLSAKRKQLSKS